MCLGKFLDSQSVTADILIIEHLAAPSLQPAQSSNGLGTEIKVHTPQASSKTVKAGTTLVLKTDCTLSYLKLPKGSGIVQFLNHTVQTFCIATSADPQNNEVVRVVIP